MEKTLALPCSLPFNFPRSYLRNNTGRTEHSHFVLVRYDLLRVPSVRFILPCTVGYDLRAKPKVDNSLGFFSFSSSSSSVPGLYCWCLYNHDHEFSFMLLVE